jgi:hypothetical protein
MTRGDFPVGGSPEAVAKWFGFASVAELEASHARAAAEMTADTIAEELAEELAEAEADDPDPWAAPPDYRPATREEKEAFHEEMQRRCADPEPAAEAENWYSADYDAEAAEYDVEPEAGL